jgi:hypothetical protein
VETSLVVGALSCAGRLLVKDPATVMRRNTVNADVKCFCFLKELESVVKAWDDSGSLAQWGNRMGPTS